MPRFAAVRATAVVSLLPLLGACAAAIPATSARTAPQEVLWIRGDANAKVTLTGTPVTVVANKLPRRGDTVYAALPFAVAMPKGAFELRIESQGVRTATAPVVAVEFNTVDAAGNTERIEAEGRRLVVQRLGDDQEVTVSGAGRRVIIVHDLALVSARAHRR